MASEIAIINILTNDSNVGSLVGGVGTAARIQAIELPQNGKYPAICVQLQDVEPSDTKGNPSKLDLEIVVCEVYTVSDFPTARKLADFVRTALDGLQNQTVNIGGIMTIKFDHLWFDSEMHHNDQNVDKLYNVIELTFYCRVQR